MVLLARWMEGDRSPHESTAAAGSPALRGEPAGSAAVVAAPRSAGPDCQSAQQLPR